MEGEDLLVHILPKGSVVLSHLIAQSLVLGAQRLVLLAHLVTQGLILLGHVAAHCLIPSVHLIAQGAESVPKRRDGLGQVAQPPVDLLVGALKPADAFFRHHHCLAQ